MTLRCTRVLSVLTPCESEGKPAHGALRRRLALTPLTGQRGPIGRSPLPQRTGIVQVRELGRSVPASQRSHQGGGAEGAQVGGSPAGTSDVQITWGWGGWAVGEADNLLPHW